MNIKQKTDLFLILFAILISIFGIYLNIKCVSPVLDLKEDVLIKNSNGDIIVW